jgi:chromosome partitioning protein
MRTVSVINLKGGVAKTVSAVNIAHILATVHHKRVLLVDNDKQGNASKYLNLHSYDDDGIADAMRYANKANMRGLIRHNRTGLDVLPANMRLLKANLEVQLNQSIQQQTRLKRAFEVVADNYDYCVIDNAPDINISTINALVASDDVLIPIKIDQFAFDGLAELAEQLDNVRELNPALNLIGGFFTCFSRAVVDTQGEDWLRANGEIPLLKTKIRFTEKVSESTFARIPITEYSRWCNASRDYISLTSEYLECVSESDTRKG